MDYLKHCWALLRGKFPSALPKGKAEFDSFAKSIFEIYGLPDLPSYRHAIATMIMHLSPNLSHCPKSHFAQSIRKAMANQIAYAKIQEIKEAEDAALKLEQEVTSLPPEPLLEPTPAVLDG